MSWAPTAHDVADRYGDARSRVVAIVAGLSGDQVETNVPSTPKWSVRELISHMVGCPADMLAGNFPGDFHDEWTQTQVAARRGRSIGELLDEWQGIAGPLDTAIRAGEVPSPIAFDVITHEQDLRGAVGAAPTPDPLAVRFVTGGFAARVDRVVADSGLPPLQFQDPEAGWSAGVPGGVAASATEFEWFRALTGRRSGRQVSSFAWTGDPSPYLDLLCPFGPLRETDVSD
jgi:uncharacterized protein (TIGR03083 family)